MLNTPSGPRTAVLSEDQELQGIPLTFTEPLTVYDFLEPGTGNVEDRLIVSAFTVSFLSDSENGPPIPAITDPNIVVIRGTEQPNVPVTVASAAALIAISDGEVPEPGTLALCGIAWQRHFAIAGSLDTHIHPDILW